MLIGIQDEILRLAQLGLLDSLLKDQTTGHNIRWATDAYTDLGHAYAKNAEIKSELIIGEHSGVIRNRARKELELQSGRTKSHAEVFTPIWVCNKMIDAALEESHSDATQTEDSFIQSRWLEITCGEAPFLVQRYDVLTGEIIPIEQRKGILDRKLQSIASQIIPNPQDSNANEHPRISIGTGNRGGTAVKKWFQCAVRAFQSTYGYELQGDNLLIARLNLYMTFEEYFNAICPRKPTQKESLQIIDIITWNVWQMDGLTNHTPGGEEPPSPQRSLFDWAGLSTKTKDIPKPCQIRLYIDAKNFKTLTISQLAEEGDQSMKFDYILGNPPYQEETVSSRGFAPPLYHKYINEAYKLSDKVIIIHPARFLFNAGSTPSEWNNKMLNDAHLKVVYFEKESNKMFSETDIKGGIAITYHDTNRVFGAIEIYTLDSNLNSIILKVKNRINHSLAEISFVAAKFDIEQIIKEHPELSDSFKERRMTTNVFETFKDVLFFNNKLDNEDCILVYGRNKNKRSSAFINQKYLDVNSLNNLCKYKIFIAKANGSGLFGESLTTLIVGAPNSTNTHSYISMGYFDTLYEANNLIKFIKTKFTRCLLSVLKVTQDITPEKWKYVPLQDFTSNSDIDWTKSIPEIDQQLYKKYGLDKDEIDFIESHVKPMD